MGAVHSLGGGHACCQACTLLADNGRIVANAMQLRDWTIVVGHDPPSDAQAEMTVDLAAERKLLRLRAGESFWELDEPERRHALAHEFAHALLRDLYETVRVGISEELSGTALRVFLAQVRTEKERAVDVLASVIAPLLAPLEW